MQMYDIEEYYRPRRFPWLPVIVVAILVIGVGLAIFSGDSGQKHKVEPAAVGGDVAATGAQAADVTAPPAIAAVVPVPDKPISKAAADAAIAEARGMKTAGDLEGSRNKYLSILTRVDAATRPEIEREIGSLSIELFTTPRPMKGKVEYIVKSGDSLSAIASRYECPVELISKANKIKDPAKIRVGSKLVFPDNPKFSVVVSKASNTLTLLLDGVFFKNYSVGTGMYSKTPVGTFKIVKKISEPPWWPEGGKASVPYGDPKNILGTRWLAIEATGDTPRVSGYGIHGTWDDSTIGKQSSAGCVRMRNPDVEEVFMLLPRGTPVSIVE